MEQKLIISTKEKLNNAIEKGADFNTIYSISLELDKLIADFYMGMEG